MNIKAQNIALAKLDGWKVAACHVGKNIPPYLMAYERGPNEKVMGSGLSRYTSDLNAMHELEKKCIVGNEMEYYRINLYEATGAKKWPFDATAAHRAEALLRTLNLWIPDAA